MNHEKRLHIRVDHERCQGHALCSAAGPRVYVLDDSGYNRMAHTSVGPDLKQEAHAGADACPERAITLHQP
ncbi:MAG: ferredoxin [Hyphomonadaceae bacterium]|nr:ferredoxin [Hyphomonadaceae bacterium]